MIEVQEPPVAPPVRRRWWVIPLVVVGAVAAGVGVAVALANRDDTATPAQAASSQLADINQACTTWMQNDARWDASSPTWCQEMTGWMTQQMANGSMMGPMMWGDPEQMLATCRAWMDANPAGARPTGWCDDMMRGMWPHMNGDWDHWDDWMNGPMMGG